MKVFTFLAFLLISLVNTSLGYPAEPDIVQVTQPNTNLTISFGQNIDPSTQPFTFCFPLTVSAANLGKFNRLVATDGEDPLRFRVDRHSNNTISLAIQSNTSSGNTEFTITPDTEHRICVQLDGKQMVLWKDGVRGSSQESVKSYSFHTLSSNLTVYNDNQVIRQISVYNGLLPDSTLAQLSGASSTPSVATALRISKFQLTWDHSYTEEKDSSGNIISSNKPLGFKVYQEKPIAKFLADVTPETNKTYQAQVNDVEGTQYCYTVTAFNNGLKDGQTVLQESTKSNVACGTVPVTPITSLPLALQDAATAPHYGAIEVQVQKPANATAATLGMDVFDADIADEGELWVNGNGPIPLFPNNTQDGVVSLVQANVPLNWLVDGVNKLRFVHVRTDGYRVDTAQFSFTIPPPVIPSTPTVSNIGPIVKWVYDGSVQVDGYKVYRRSPTDDWSLLTETQGDFYVDQSGTPGENYCYQITAFNAQGESPRSVEQTCSIQPHVHIIVPQGWVTPISRRPAGAFISITSTLVNAADEVLYNQYDEETEIMIFSRHTITPNKVPTQINRVAILVNENDIIMVNGVIISKDLQP